MEATLKELEEILTSPLASTGSKVIEAFKWLRKRKKRLKERIAILDMKTPHPTKTIKELKELLK